MNRSKQMLMRRTFVGLGIALMAVVALVASAPVESQAAGTASDGPGDAAAWTTGNKLAVGTSADTTSKVWFTAAKGITTEVFYPRLDIPNMQDMQYIVTDGSTFVDLERDATNHMISMPDEKALEYTVTNTDKRTTSKYRITNTYVTDPSRNTLLIRTRFQSLDGGTYQLYLLENASIAGGGANNNAWWDSTNSALMSSGTESLLGSSLTVVSALKVATPNGFVAHDNGYAGKTSDCNVDLSAHRVLNNQFDNIASNGNVVQCGQIGSVGTDTTFTVALGYGSDATSAINAVNGSLTAGFTDREAAYRGISPYRGGWEGYVNGLRAAPASVSRDTLRRRAYYVAAMALHAAEDKTFPGASVAGFATPWGDFTNGDNLNDGYHRVWGRDLYQQATGLIAAGDSAQPLRMAQFLWNSQYISTNTSGAGTMYPPGSFPRYSPVSGSIGASPQDLGCCEQLDEDAFAIVLAWMTGLTDNATYQKIKAVANHIQAAGPDTTESWEEQFGKSVSSIAAEIAGLVAAADVARQNGDTTSAAGWESTADSWRSSLAGWTFTTGGYWGGHQYYERIDKTSNPNDGSQLQFDEGSFYAHDVVDFGFLDLVRLGERVPSDSNVSISLSPTASASDGNSAVQVTMTTGDIYFHRYNHDNYGESNTDCKGWPANGANRYGRLWPVLSGERGEFEIANGRPLLYATNFRTAKIDVFDSTFTQTTVAGSFSDPNVQHGYAPFGIQTINGNLWVTYALQDAAKHDSVNKPGHGFVSVFDADGNLLQHFAQHGHLSSPWGEALAPASFGEFANDILIGNFGDGMINVYDPANGHWLGMLADGAGKPIVNLGLWSVTFSGASGANAAGSDPDTLYIMAGLLGPTHENAGLFAKIAPN